MIGLDVELDCLRVVGVVIRMMKRKTRVTLSFESSFNSNSCTYNRVFDFNLHFNKKVLDFKLK
jgi:hypothetical protein